MIIIQHMHATTTCMCSHGTCMCIFGQTLGGIMGLAQHAEKKVEIFKFVQVFPSNFFSFFLAI